MEDVDDFLEHFGVMGMKWGVRKDDGPAGVDRKINKEAKKDATEFARAKMFYGEGAGTRRKLINTKVNSRSEKSAQYKKAFDYHLERQDMEAHTEKAKSERVRKNVANSTAKTARGIKNVVFGNPQYASIAAIAVGSAGVAAYNAGVHKKIAKWGKVGYMKATTSLRANRIKKMYNSGGLL